MKIINYILLAIIVILIAHIIITHKRLNSLEKKVEIHKNKFNVIETYLLQLD